MILELGVDSFGIGGGFLTADVRAKTDRGVVGFRASFELRKSPELDALVPMIEKEIHTALAKSLGMTQAIGVEGKA